MGEYGNKIKEVYNIPSINRWENNNQHEFGTTFDGLLLEEYENLGWKYGFYATSYNRAVHTSTGKSPFETCFGYFPPSPLDVVYG